MGRTSVPKYSVKALWHKKGVEIVGVSTVPKIDLLVIPWGPEADSLNKKVVELQRQVMKARVYKLTRQKFQVV